MWTCYTFKQLRAAKYNSSFQSSSSGVIWGSCLAQGTSRLVAEGAESNSPSAPRPPPPSFPASLGLKNNNLEVRKMVRMTAWRWKDRHKNGRNILLSAIIVAITLWNLWCWKRRCFSLLLFADSNLTSRSILIMDILGHTVRLTTLNIKLFTTYRWWLLLFSCTPKTVFLWESDKKPSLKIKKWLEGAH